MDQLELVRTFVHLVVLAGCAVADLGFGKGEFQIQDRAFCVDEILKTMPTFMAHHA